MMTQYRIPELSNGELHIKTYKDVTNNIICKTLTCKCYFVKFDNCPGRDDLNVRLEEAFSAK